MIGCTLGLVRFPIGVAGSLPGCIAGHSEYRVSQPDVQLCNWLSGCITGFQLHNRHSWPSVQNICQNNYTSGHTYKITRIIMLIIILCNVYSQ